MTKPAPRSLSGLLTRRRLLAGAALGAALLAGAVPALAQQKKGPAAPAAAAADAALDELMKPGPIPDLALGKADAPVTIVEYASMTCGHCATFHNTVFPALKEKYVDTGKVRLILREFPLDNLAAAASMLARCAGGDKTYALISTLFKDQDAWAFVKGNPVPALFKIAEAAGFTKESFDKCLTDQKLLDGITGTRDRASKSFNITSTPTFFVNGKRLNGPSDQIETFDKAIEPLLGAKPAPAAAPATPAPAAPAPKK